MSDTPRTDAVSADDTITYSEGVPVDFARELERELAEERAFRAAVGMHLGVSSSDGGAELAAIKRLVAAFSETVKWVPVEERMPSLDDADDQTLVLVVVDSDSGNRHVDVTDRMSIHSGVGFAKEHGERCPYTHWMPFPEAPK